MGRFETEMLSTKSNLLVLMKLSGKWIDQVHKRTPLRELILDMDSSVSETYGDLEWAMLRRGNHHSAKFWRPVVLPVIERYRCLATPKFFRGDAAFADPKLMTLLEAEDYRYAIRLKPNVVLELEIEHLLKRPMGRDVRMAG
jgi:hypothetical protein